jgi:hypothetical protein
VKNAPDYGGRKSPHFTQIYDAMFLLAFCSTAPKEHAIEELEPVSFEIFMSSFNALGKPAGWRFQKHGPDVGSNIVTSLMVV